MHALFLQSQTQSSPPLQGIFPTINIVLPTPVQHSLDQPSSPTHHNAPEPPSNQPSSPTRHNPPEPPSNQPSSPTHHNAPEPPADQPSCSTIQSHINPTFLASRLRNMIPSQSFDHCPRPTEWSQVSYASFSF